MLNLIATSMAARSAPVLPPDMIFVSIDSTVFLEGVRLLTIPAFINYIEISSNNFCHTTAVKWQCFLGLFDLLLVTI